MIANAAPHLIVSESQTLFTTGCSLPGVLPFPVSFLFFCILDLLSFFLHVAFFAGGWLLLKLNSSSDMWNKFARVWIEIPKHESEAIDLESNMQAQKKKKKKEEKKMEVITGQPTSKSVVMTKLPGSSQFIIIIINPLTARVAGAPQMILQPVFSIFPCSPLPSGTWRTPCLNYLFSNNSCKQFSWRLFIY